MLSSGVLVTLTKTKKSITEGLNKIKGNRGRTKEIEVSWVRVRRIRIVRGVAKND